MSKLSIKYSIIRIFIMFISALGIVHLISWADFKVGPNSINRLNILLIVSEDNSANLGCYGDTISITHNLDKLASEGVRFDNAYATESVCSPSRSTIFTGLYPHENGQIGLATHQYVMFKKWDTSYKLLKSAGYRTGLIGKTHVNPESAVEEYVDMRYQKGANFEKDGLAEYSKKAGDFIRTTKKPFFLTVNFPDAHWPLQNQVEGRPINPMKLEEIRTLPFIGTTSPDIQKSLQGYYNSMKRLDECVGELLSELENSGKADNTVVIYISDHGAQMARGKVTLLEGGVKIPCLIRWPGVTKKGTSSKALWSTMDLLPTFLDISSVNKLKNLSGRSVKPLLERKIQDAEYRNYLFTERNSEAVPFYYPQRTVRDKQFKLIWSPLRDRSDPAAQFYLEHKRAHCFGSPLQKEVVIASPQVVKAYDIWLNPPLYQLYDLENDPWEFNDLSENPNYKLIKNRLIEELKNWQTSTNDFAASPHLLKKLTIENDFLSGQEKRSPEGGWDYLNYLDPQK